MTTTGGGSDWPLFCPVADSTQKRVDALYAIEEKDALTHKEKGNESYKERNFNEALLHYERALHCFSNNVATDEKMVKGLLLGTVVEGCGRDSPVRLLAGAAPEIGRRIASFLTSAPYFFYRLPAICCGNMSIVLRALGRGGVWEYARRSCLLDPTYAKALDLLKRAATDRNNTFPANLRPNLEKDLEHKQTIFRAFAENIGSNEVGMLATGMIRSPIDFCIMEQKRAYNTLGTLMNSDTYLDCMYEPSPKSVYLSLSLVPFRGAEESEGQWLLVTLGFLDTTRETFSDDDVEIPEMALSDVKAFHFACADPENGGDVELPPNGRASTRAVAFVLERVPQVAETIKERFGLTVRRVRCGQGLVDLTGPNGPDSAREVGIGSFGLPSALPSAEEREGPAREFRTNALPAGPESERLWSVWDEFSRDVKVVPAHSTYASEKAAGSMFGLPFG